MISWKMAAAWVAALVVTTVLTWQIVGLADSQVGDTPVAVAPVPTSVASSSTTTSTAPTTSTTIPATTSTSLPASTTSTSAAPTTTPPTTPTTTTPKPTTVDAEWTVRTINSEGGTVIVRHRPGEVELQTATPAAGFSVEIDDSGPTRVRVEFESDDDDIRVEVQWDDGELDIEIDD